MSAFKVVCVDSLNLYHPAVYQLELIAAKRDETRLAYCDPDEGDQISITAVQGVVNGSAVINLQTGHIRFIPLSDFIGAAGFS